MDEKMIFESQLQIPTKNCTFSEIAYSYDIACLEVISSLPYIVTIKEKSDECYQCAFEPWVSISEGNQSFMLSTIYRTQYHYVVNNMTCGVNFPFADHGIYALNITEDGCQPVQTLFKPKDMYYPVLLAFVIGLTGGILWKILYSACNSNVVVTWRRGNTRRSELEDDLGRTPISQDPSIPYSQELQTFRRKLEGRVKSLDTFRGLTIALMIFVNYGGGKYSVFEHSAWNGLTVADLVFPWFAWIMGVSIAISLRSRLRNSITRRTLIFQVLRRSLLLFMLGLILNTIGGYRNGFTEIRIFGVLQRLGLGYFIVASLETFMMKPQGMVIDGFLMHIREVVECWAQWLIVLIMVSCHTCLTLLLRVPNCPVGYLGPGGRHNHGIWANCTGGAAGYIDRIILGVEHMYQTPTCHQVYQTTMPYDPEGILGTMTAVLLIYLGVQAGRILLAYNGHGNRISRFLIWSALTGIIAAFLCKFSKERGVIPVNKNLWSLSFVLVTACFAFFIKALLFVIIDMKKWWSGNPFLFAGMNPLLLYVGHVLTEGMFPFFWKPLFNTHGELLAMNLWGTALWILISYCLCQYNIFISI